MEEESGKISADKFRRRSGIIFVVLIMWAVLAAAHIFYYSIIKREKLLKESTNLAWREGTLPPLRGRILSADSKLLAWTELSHDLILKKIPATTGRFNSLLRQLTDEVPDLTPDEKEDFILLKQDISPDDILKLEKVLSRYSELLIIPRMSRRTINDPAIKEALGETESEKDDPTLTGKSGYEKTYDAILSGRRGTFRVMLDRRGNWVSGTIEVKNQPENGRDVTLPETANELRNRKKT